MSRGVNKVTLIGHLGDDPVVRYMTSGDAVVNFKMATGEKWKDKEGKTVEKTEWHKIVFFKKIAEVCANYLKKGSKVYIQGSLRTRKWQDKQNVDQYTTEIVGDEMVMLDSLKDNQQPLQTVSKNERPAERSPAINQIADDDIPF